MELLILQNPLQIVSNWSHDVDVDLNVAPISQGNKFDFSILWPRINKCDIDP